MAIPTIIIIDATIFPPGVTGYKSPYPTVVTVAIAHQKASVTSCCTAVFTGVLDIYLWKIYKDHAF